MAVELCGTKSGKVARKRFGEFLLHEGEIDEYNLERALRYQRVEHVALGVLAVQEKYLNERQLCDIKGYQRERGGLFGEIAIKLGLLKDDCVNTLLEIQKRKNVRIGDLLVMFGAISREDMESQLQYFCAMV